MKRQRVLRAAAVLLAALFTALLTGCSFVGGTVNLDELLRAPQLSGEYSAVQTALNSYLGESAQLRYPTHGDLLSPFLFGDWDGDGTQDAAVLYSATDSSNVQIAVLQKDAQGKWSVRSTAVGLSDTVDTVSFAAVQNVDTDQIVVGYATSGDTYLAVYAYAGGTLETVLQQLYTQYLVEDITGSGTEDIILLSSDAEGQTQVQLLTYGSDGFTSMQVVGLSSDKFSGYASLAAGKGSVRGSYLVLDGWTGANGSYLASSILQYDAETGRMDTAVLPGTSDIYTDSIRYVDCLTSRDIDGDGIVEVPAQGEEAGILNLTQTKRYSFVRWMDFTSTSAEKSFGIVDSEYGFYLRLPAEWEGNLMMTDRADGGIELYNLSGDQLLLSMRLTGYVGAAGGWRRVSSVAGQQIQVQVGADVVLPDGYDLMQAVYLL